MAVSFRQKMGEVSIQIEFDQPTFSLFSNVLALGRALLIGLSPFGVKLADLKFAGETTYAETHVTVFLYNLSAELNVRPERIEIRSYDPAKRLDAFGALEAAVTAALEFATDAKPKSCTSVTALHAELAGVATRDFIARFVASAPSQLGAQFASGIVFYLEPSDGRLMASVNVEPSATVQGGLFFRVTNVWSAGAGSLMELAKREEDTIANTFAAFDLERV